MSGKQNFAWVVVVPNDNSVECAILAAKMLRRAETSAKIVALVSCSVSMETLCSLNDTFGLVIVRNTSTLAKENGWKEGKEQDLLLVSAVTLEIFSKVIVLAPGVLPVRQLDHLFDDVDDDLMGSCRLKMDKDWKVVRMEPNTRKITRVMQAATEEMNGLLHNFFEMARPEVNAMIYSCEEVTCLADLQKLQGSGLVHVSKAVANVLIMEMTKSIWIPPPGLGDSHVSEQEDTGDWIAIVGMACRFPQANSLEEYWDILENERNTCSTPPDHRMSLVEMDPEIKANFLKCPIDQFDAGFFGISPSEAGFTDPQVRLLLEVSWEAFEEAGINPETLRGSKTGVFYGAWMQEYKEALNDLCCSSPSQDFLRKYLGNGFGSSSAKISYFYGFTGPNIATESGCSSSMVAVDMAVKSLQRRECPMAIACGANLILHLIKQQKVWALDGRSKTFDEGADGYARAEGIAVMIMKRYSDAVRDGDNIHGIIRGSATGQEGLSKSFGTPTVESEFSVMYSALKAAKVEPNQVDYLEAHATGTAVGDPIEAAAIVKAYSGGERLEPLWIGSGKTNVGHTESCSGMAGIIKVVLAMQHEKIPKHLNVTKVNPQVDFSSIPGEICLNSRFWPKKLGQSRIAGVSSFGITGTDVHVIIQEAPDLQKRKASSTSLTGKVGNIREYLLTLSAKSDIALEQLTENFRIHLESISDAIEDITFTANACRPHHQFRKAVVAQSKTEMALKLQSGNHPLVNRNILTKRKICFSFPGTIGNVDITGLRNLYETLPYFKITMDKCDTIFKKVTGRTRSLLAPLFHPVMFENSDADWDALVPTCQFSLAKLWMHWGVRPNALLGHCFGDLSALISCGALKLEDFYKLVDTIPHFVQCQRDAPATLMAINTNYNSVEQLIKTFLENDNDDNFNWIDVTSVNSNDQTVVAGPQRTIQAFKEFCQEVHKLRCKIIYISFCAHSRAVEPAYQKSMQLFNQMNFHPLQIPVISSATGKLLSDSELNGQHLYNLFRNRVNFTTACETVQENGLGDIIIEIGFNGALTKFTKDNMQSGSSSVCLPTFSKFVTGGITNSVAELYTLGVNFNWSNYYHDRGQRVKLPQYPFQRKSFWFEPKIKARVMMGEMEPEPMQKFLHPFLGAHVESHAGFDNFVIFQNNRFAEINNDKQTKFIEDHAIGSKVIFPGAGFLEMILSSWKLSLKENMETNSSEISIKNFKIHAPLLVDEKVPKKVQCVVNMESQIISVYASSISSGSTWRLHASAEITVFKEDPSVLDLESIVMNEYLNNIDDDKIEQGVSAVEEFYVTAAQVGLNFGEKFKSLRCIHRNQSEDILVEVKSVSGYDNQENFLCHPILMDAMIQAFIAWKKPDLKRLHVPVQIGKLTVFPRRITGHDEDQKNTWYIYCKNTSSLISLLDQDGRCVAIMENLEVVATSVESVLSSAETWLEGATEKGQPVNIYNVTWQRSHFYQQTDNSQTLAESPSDVQQTLSTFFEIKTSLQAFNTFSEEEAKLDQVMNRLCYLYVVKALLELGWTPNVHSTVAVNSAEEWGIIPSLVPAFKHYLSYLEDPIETTGGGGVAEVEKEIRKILELPLIRDYAAMLTIQECGSNLSGILRGTVSPHKILFDERNLADHYYQTTRFLTFLPHLDTFFKHLVSSFKSEDSNKRILRILEVGAGTGAFPKKMIPVLNAMGIQYEYHFTDISPTLVSKATGLFSEEDNKCFVFKTLNLEIDPLSQGFSPEYFDLVVAVDVLHATRDLRKTLKNITLVTNVGGRILLGETEKPVREVDISFGILEGYWLFEDEIRSGHCTVDSTTWLHLLAEIGFSGDPCSLLFSEGQMSVISARKTCESLMMTKELTITPRRDWIIFHFDEQEQVNPLKNYMEFNTGRSVTLVILDVTLKGREIEEVIVNSIGHLVGSSLEGIIFWYGFHDFQIQMEPRSILEPLLFIAQYFLQSRMKLLPRLCLVTEGCWKILDGDKLNIQSPVCGMAWGFLRNVRIEVHGIQIKCVDLQIESETSREENMIRQVITELWLDDKEGEVVYREGTRFLRRLTEEQDSQTKELDIPEEGEFQVELPRSKAINDVKFVKMESQVEEGGGNSLGEHQVKVEIRCVSLNFKDVLSVLKPSWEFDDLKFIGIDFSGVVSEIGTKVMKWKEGDAVFSHEWVNGCMKSHVTIAENLLMAVPPTMTFAEAATLPAVFFTVWHCMVNVAKLKAGQTVLVHAASGGVGLVAIQIAKLIEAQVIGTAGNDKKRKFLKCLGVQHVFSSRTLDFEQQIMTVTQGHGVDMVLNCLTGPGFKEASLAVCRDGGHFVEISKRDIWSVDQLCIRRPLVKYDIVQVTDLAPQLIINMIHKLCELLEERKIESLPYVAFPACRLVEALEYLQKAKQIGKVIITMPHQDVLGKRKDLLFHERITILITGGKGAIGFAVCKWVISQGARFVVLVGRSEASQEIKQQIVELEKDFGAVIICRELDISDFNECKNLISEITENLHMPPLRSIHHCAGILSDKMIANQDWENFSRVLKPKVNGAWNLHQCTLSMPLEHFVLYSSACTTFGHAGQSNYVSGSAYLDHLAQFRRSNNLPALSINWGKWRAGLAQDISTEWLPSFSVEEGIAALEHIIRHRTEENSGVVAGNFEFSHILKSTPFLKNTFLETISIGKSTSIKSTGKNSEEPDVGKVSLVDNFPLLQNSEERSNFVRKYILRVLCETLGTLEDEIPDQVPFSEMGMDSLMSIDFTNKIYSGLESSSEDDGGSSGGSGVYIDLEENGTLNKLTDFIVAVLEKSNENK